MLLLIDTGAGGLINPNKTYADVESESQVGHELYRSSHLDFDVGEQLKRAYTSANFDEKSKFGIPTPHDNTGRLINLSCFKKKGLSSIYMQLCTFVN